MTLLYDKFFEHLSLGEKNQLLPLGNDMCKKCWIMPFMDFLPGKQVQLSGSLL